MTASQTVAECSSRLLTLYQYVAEAPYDLMIILQVRPDMAVARTSAAHRGTKFVLNLQDAELV